MNFLSLFAGIGGIDRKFHKANECCVFVGHEGGDAPHVEVTGGSGVLIADGGERCAGSDLGKDRVGVDAVRLEE